MVAEFHTYLNIVAEFHTYLNMIAKCHTYLNKVAEFCTYDTIFDAGFGKAECQQIFSTEWLVFFHCGMGVTL